MFEVLVGHSRHCAGWWCAPWRWAAWAWFLRWNVGFWMHVAAVAGSAVQWSGGLLHLVHVRNFLDVVLLYVLGHGVHDAGHVLLGLRVVIEFQPRAAIWTEIVGIGSVAVIAMRAKSTGPSFHDVVNLVAGQVLGKYLQVLRRGKVAGWAAGSGRRALRCLGNG